MNEENGRNKCDACSGDIEGAFSMKQGFMLCAKCRQSEALAIRVAQQKHRDILKAKI